MAYYAANRETILAKERAKYGYSPFKPTTYTTVKFSENPTEYRRQHRKAWIAAHPEKKKQYNRDYHINHQSERCEATRKWIKNNPERHRAKHAEYYRANRETVKAKVKKYREDNPEKVREMQRRWAGQNIELRRLHGRISAERRKERQCNAAGEHNTEDWLQKVEFYGYRCYYCKKSLHLREITQDHAIPLARGGSAWIANILPACGRCNRKKHTKTVFEYIALLRSRSTTSAIIAA